MKTKIKATICFVLSMLSMWLMYYLAEIFGIDDKNHYIIPFGVTFLCIIFGFVTLGIYYATKNSHSV